MTVTHFMQNEKFPTSKLVARKLVAGILYRFFFIQKKNAQRSLSPHCLHAPGRFLSTLRDRARSIATVTTFCDDLSSFTTVVTDADGETAAEGGGIGSMLLIRARSSMVEKLLNVDLSRLEDGDMLREAPTKVNCYFKSSRFFLVQYLRTLASSSSSSSGGGRFGREWKRNTERSCVAASLRSDSTSRFVSSMSRFGTGYRTPRSIFTLPSMQPTDIP